MSNEPDRRLLRRAAPGVKDTESALDLSGADIYASWYTGSPDTRGSSENVVMPAKAGIQVFDF